MPHACVGGTAGGRAATGLSEGGIVDLDQFAFRDRRVACGQLFHLAAIIHQVQILAVGCLYSGGDGAPAQAGPAPGL
jgi:hypothetical protein